MVDFSIVIAVYNGGRTLRKTLDSLVNQTFKNFEVVLVDDESRDSSDAIITSFIQEHPQICVRYIRQKNKGLGGARNTGMRESQGCFVSLLDQDDIWYPEKLEKVFAIFKKCPEISFVTHRVCRRVCGNIREVVYTDSVGGSLFRKLLFDTNFLCGCAMSFRKDVLEKIGTFTEERGLFHLSEDYDYWLRASGAGLLFHLIEEPLGEYVEHTDNFSNNWRVMFRNEWNVVRRHYQTRTVRKFWDPLLLSKRRGKILARQALALLGVR